nr:reverse transcriptase domain-containing protein [Tanacetum cinerariifolium]
MSISALMKCTIAIRQFAYDNTPDAFDEYLQMSEHTARDAQFFFNMCIMELYMPKYIRKPTSEDVVNIQQKHNNVHGFSRMLGSIDSGANNDINVLDNSSLFDDVLDDLALVVSYVVNGVEYHNGYYLADGIYPEWASFIKSLMVATDPKHTYLNSVKKVHGKMSNVLSVFSKDVEDLFNNQPVHTKSTHYVESLVTLRVRYPLDLCEIRIKGRRHINLETHWRDLQLEVCKEIQVVEVVGPKSTGSIQSRFRSRIEGLRFLVAQRKLEVKQLEMTNTDCLVKEHETVHLGIKVEVDIMIIGVPGQAGVEDNAVEKKKVKEEVIEIRATLQKTQVVDGVITVMPITTAEEKAQKRLEVKAKSTLMMGISNEHQLKFNSIKDTNTNGVVNTAQAVNTANGVSTASTQVNDVENLSDVVICAFLASQPSPQLAHVDLEQIHPDDMEEMDLRWKMTMLTIRARRLLKKTRRKLNVNGNETLGFDMSKRECYNCYKRGHFTREFSAPRNQDNKHNESTRRSLPIETHASTALVSCDGLGGHDWSDQAEEGPNYALMAYTSLTSDLKIFDNYKKGLGYESYNVVPPPYTENFMSPKPVVKNKSSEEKTKTIRQNTDALIIEEWVSDCGSQTMMDSLAYNEYVTLDKSKITMVETLSVY